MTCGSGATELDGPVDVLVVTEEAGDRPRGPVRGALAGDPGREFSQAPAGGAGQGRRPVGAAVAAVHQRHRGELDRTVLAGEAGGRWLWLVLRPASAMLLLHEDWLLQDVSALGAPLLEMPFGGPPPTW